VADVLEQMKTFLGDQYQTPPMFSAKKVNGQPLYKLARKGKTIAREPRVIHVSRFELTSLVLPELSFLVGCSKGAYVRTIAHDLGEKFSCGAHLNALRRTGIGDFSIEKADTLEVLREASPTALRKKLIPILQAVPTHAL
jgi:tRNA pseudouridine55 synthase